MSDPTDDDHDLWEALAPLAAVTPSPGRTDAVLRSARRSNARRASVRWGLAAAAVLAVGVGGAMWTVRPASAADQLARAADASGRYQGWVHMRVVDDRGQLVAIEHVDTRTGFSVKVVHGDGEVAIGLSDPIALRQANYFRSEHTIYVSPMSPASASRTRNAMQNLPLTSAAAAAQVPGVTVKRSVDGDRLRFELTLPPDDPKTAAAQHRTVYPRAVTFWVDPATDLIVRATSAGLPGDETFTYGDPGVTDLYAAGVPRDAKVVDLTPPRDAADLLARLRRRHDAGLGDGVAVMTEASRYAVAGKPPGPVERSVTVFGTAGTATAAQAFRIDAARASLKSSDLPGWPAPGVDAVLAAGGKAIPRNFTIVTGQGPVWRGHSSSEDGTIESSDVSGENAVQLAREVDGANLPHLLWPAADLQTVDTDGSIKLLPADSGHAGWVGLQVDRSYFLHAPDDTRLRMVYWFDPSRDDIVVDRTDTYTSVATGQLVWRRHETLGAFEPTANGRFFPSWRRVEQVTDDPKGMGRSTSDMTAELSFESGRRLPPQWYADPVARGARGDR
jgi:hypothetical protein